MNLLAALLLLASASDVFDPGWTFATSGWQYGAEHAPVAWLASPDGSTIQGQQATGASDLLHHNPRPILRSERPFVRARVKIPAIPTLLNYSGHRTYFAIRETETVEPSQTVYPGVFIGRNAAGTPKLFFRALADNIETSFVVTENEWLTIGLGWSATGALQCYAHEGQATLTDADLIGEDQGWYINPLTGQWEQSELVIKHMTNVRGLYLDVANVLGLIEQPIWTLSRIETFADVRPTLTIAPPAATLTVSGFPNENYVLERSANLTQWDGILVLQSGESFVDPIVSPHAFYRLNYSDP